MDSSSEQHQQMSSQSLENMLACSKAQEQDKKPRPQPELALKCPRCDSSNTKFCYYNNYSLSQPRYFCKSCRRYWTKGGTLRNVPVGGGCRKNKRSSSASRRVQDQTFNPNPNPLSGFSQMSYDSSDLTQAVTVTTMKQELCSGREQNESKVLWGFPWQLNNGDHTHMGGELDSGRANWNGLTPSWHGLLNSPLM